MVLNEAGISNWQDVAAALSLSQTTWQWIKGVFGIKCWKAVLDKWQNQESCVSWDKLAEVLQEKCGIDSSQTILEISGAGGVHFFVVYYTRHSLIHPLKCMPLSS